MSKSTSIVIGVIVLLVIAGGGGYYLTQHNKNTTNSTQTAKTTSTTPPATTQTTTPKLQGNAEVQAVLDKVKANTSTVTATRVVTQSTDPNNELGKAHQYQYAGSFFDTATNPSDTTADNYSTSDGGTIEIYANSADAKTRGDYLAQFQTGAIQAGAYKVVGNVVLRVSENYTASQQTQMLTLMESAL